MAQTVTRSPFIATFLIELPFDLRLEDGTTVPAYERREHVEAPLFSLLNEHPGELEVDTRLVFRRSRQGSAHPRTVALEVFSDFWEGLHLVDSEPAQAELERDAPVTVVAATTTTLRYDAATGVIAQETLIELFDRVLHQLNDFIAMLGFVRSDAFVGTVRRTELPSHVAVMLDFPVGGARQLELSYLELHSFAPDRAPDEDDVLRAIDFAFRNRLVSWPFRSVVLLMHRARRDLLAGEYDQGVITLATAVELLTEATISEALRTEDRAHRIERVLEAGLTNLLRDHLGPLLLQLGADDGVIDRWIDQCYVLRKKVAHEGVRPQGTEAMFALKATNDLASILGTVLRQSEAYAHIGDQLPFGT